ncbi:MAG: lipocalin family protein [Myxococcota bacterium]|nr:lipocalin family protein [Myxococcota bacterium]
MGRRCRRNYMMQIAFTGSVFFLVGCLQGNPNRSEDDSQRLADGQSTSQNAPNLELVDDDSSPQPDGAEPEEQPAAMVNDSTGDVVSDTMVGTETSQGSNELANRSADDDINDPLPSAEGEASPDTAAQFMALSDGEDVVAFVDIDRYMGRWYEIATTPSFQQRACVGTTAQYTFNAEEGWVDVVNSCFVGSTSGRVQQVQGRAELVDTETQAKLQVIFFGQGAPYWVVALDGADSAEPYEWAVVSVPGGRTMWILSRTPTMDLERRNTINRHLADRGFPIDTLLDTPQDP